MQLGVFLSALVLFTPALVTQAQAPAKLLGKAMGLTTPQSLLQRADRVIQ